MALRISLVVLALLNKVIKVDCSESTSTSTDSSEFRQITRYSSTQPVLELHTTKTDGFLRFVESDKYDILITDFCDPIKSVHGDTRAPIIQIVTPQTRALRQVVSILDIFWFSNDHTFWRWLSNTITAIHNLNESSSTTETSTNIIKLVQKRYPKNASTFSQLALMQNLEQSVLSHDSTNDANEVVFILSDWGMGDESLMDWIFDFWEIAVNQLTRNLLRTVDENLQRVQSKFMQLDFDITDSIDENHWNLNQWSNEKLYWIFERDVLSSKRQLRRKVRDPMTTSKSRACTRIREKTLFLLDLNIALKTWDGVADWLLMEQKCRAAIVLTELTRRVGWEFAVVEQLTNHQNVSLINFIRN